MILSNQLAILALRRGKGAAKNSRIGERVELRLRKFDMAACREWLSKLTARSKEIA